MTIYKPSDYSFVKFKKAPASSSSKYVAILKNKSTNREVHVRFGARGYEHYKDKIGSYKSLDHGDSKRRASYRARHAGEGDPTRKYSPGWFAWHYLW